MPTNRMLIIEDDRSLSDVLIYNFQQEGFEVHRALDGQDGINQAIAKSPNFIILEYHGDHARPKSAFVDDPWRPVGGYFPLPTGLGLGMELDLAAIAAHPPRPWSRGFPTYPDGAPAFI